MPPHLKKYDIVASRVWQRFHRGHLIAIGIADVTQTVLCICFNLSPITALIAKPLPEIAEKNISGHYGSVIASSNEFAIKRGTEVIINILNN